MGCLAPAPADHQGEQPPVAPPEGDLEVSSDDAPAGTPDLAGADLPAEPPLAGAPVPNVPTIAKEDGPPIAKVDSVEAPGAQLDGPEAPRADRLQRPQPPGYPLRAAAGVDLERPAPPLASPEAVARAIDGTLGALPAVLAPWQRFELGAWGADRRDRWAREVAQARAEGAEEAAAEVLAYYRNRPGGPAAPGGALRPVANPSADPFEGPEHDQRDPFEGPATPPAAPPRRLPPPAATAPPPSRILWTPRRALERRPRPRRRPVQRPQRPRRGAPPSPARPAAARSGLVILPSGAHVDVDQADELPRPPALARFDVRHDPETDLEEHRGGHSGPTSPQTWPTGPIDDSKRPPNMTSARPSRAPVALSDARSMATLEDMPP